MHLKRGDINLFTCCFLFALMVLSLPLFSYFSASESMSHVSGCIQSNLAASWVSQSNGEFSAAKDGERFLDAAGQDALMSKLFSLAGFTAEKIKPEDEEAYYELTVGTRKVTIFDIDLHCQQNNGVSKLTLDYKISTDFTVVGQRILPVEAEKAALAVLVRT